MDGVAYDAWFSNTKSMSYALLSETTPKARKEHQCIWCGEKILIGEKYRREKSAYDGSMQNHAWHIECDLDCRAENGCGEFELEPGGSERPSARLGFENDTAQAIPRLSDSQ